MEPISSCPGCGAPLKFSAGATHLTCSFCGTAIDLTAFQPAGQLPAVEPDLKPQSVFEPPQPLASTPPTEPDSTMPDWLESAAQQYTPPPTISPVTPVKAGPSNTRLWVGCASGCASFVVLQAICGFLGLVIAAAGQPSASNEFNPSGPISALLGFIALVLSVVIFVVIAWPVLTRKR